MEMQAGSNVITIVADTPFSLPAGLKCLHLVFGNESSSTTFLKDGTLLDTYADPLRDLAWKLESIVGENCAAVAASENRILVVVEATRKKAVKKMLKKVKKKLQVSFDKSADSAVDEGRLLEVAVESVLRRGLRKQGWMPFGRLLVRSNLTAGVERSVVDTVELDVRLEPKSKIDLVLSFGAARFRQFKYLEALPESLRPKFHEGENVNLMDWIYAHSEDSLSNFECRVLPTLEPGYLVAACSSPPAGVSTEYLRTLWLEKYGIKLTKEFAFLRVRFSFQPESKAVLFPSCCVLTSGGLVPAAPSIQNTRMEPALLQFLKDVEACTFFGAAPLRVKRREGSGQSAKPKLLGHAPVWAAVKEGSEEAGKGGPLKCPPSNLVELQTLPVIRHEKPVVISRAGNGTDEEAPAKVRSTSMEKASVQPAQRPADRPLIVPSFKKRSGTFFVPQVGQRTTDLPRTAAAPAPPPIRVSKPSGNAVQNGGKLMAPSFGSRPKGPGGAKAPDTKASGTKVPKAKTAAPKSVGSKGPSGNEDLQNKGSTDVTTKRKKAEAGDEGSGKKKQKTVSISGEKQSDGKAHEGAAEKAPRKRTTAADLDVNEVDALVRAKYADQKLKDLSVPQMKNFLSQHKQRVGGKKEELVERITGFLQG
ncbi:hypothetical protein KFL_000860040 [Klebsormidium nitens]|uniref:SAP domain-containing protein n=1 Tax=Klebsormidium nitens TaxID=105231 RepID=A0A1Y1HUY7_KLENI|nr:hypothetical protein KFL_000860040 [Klebsormidium nitens]|eukprot:GAQ81632.1 hypothetical protein KFL_000860040 [Klebsormidium nitens]